MTSQSRVRRKCAGTHYCVFILPTDIVGGNNLKSTCSKIIWKWQVLSIYYFVFIMHFYFYIISLFSFIFKNVCLTTSLQNSWKFKYWLLQFSISCLRTTSYLHSPLHFYLLIIAVIYWFPIITDENLAHLYYFLSPSVSSSQYGSQRDCLPNIQLFV